MLPTTSENTRWRHWSLWILVFLIGSYVWYATRQYTHGGTPIGLLYGTVGLLLILILAYFGVRKRSYRSKFGTLETWLHSHIYLGLLVLLIILFHSGFRFNDKIAVTALILLTVVVLSGLVGAILYAMVPPMLADVKSDLSAGEISDQINQLAQKMARLASEKSAAFQKIYADHVQAERPGIMAGWSIMFRRHLRQRSEKNSSGSFQVYQDQVGPDEQSDLTQLLVLAQQMRELNDRLIDKQRYINIMASWLYLHVPLTVVMMVFVTVHVIAFFYYW